MIRPSSLKRPFTAPKLKSSTKNPYYLEIDPINPNETEDNMMITQQNLKTFINSFNYERNDPQNYLKILKNNAKRGLRSDENFKKFDRLMLRLARNSKAELQEAKEKIKEIENTSKKIQVQQSDSPKKQNEKKRKNFEKKMKILSEKHNNKTSLGRINEIMREIYEEKRKTKKIVKYLDSFKVPQKNSRMTSNINTSIKFSQIKTKKSESVDNSQTNILENDQSSNTLFMPRAVKKALDQLKNFIIDIPLLDDDKMDENEGNNLKKIIDNEKEPKNSSFFFRKISRILPGQNYNNEKHLKDDFKMFKGRKGNKIVRKFTDMVNEEAHDKEMEYYLKLVRLKNVGIKTNEEKNKIYDFNDELRKVYKKEAMIRNHGKSFRRKFNNLKSEINQIDKDHLPAKKVDKLEIKIHRGLMSDYKKEEKKFFADLVEKMNPQQLKHKKTL